MRELVERFERHIRAYRSPQDNETQLRREFLDAHWLMVTVFFRASTTQAAPGPELAVSISNEGNFIVSWPSSFQNFLLEETDSLDAPPAWQAVTATPQPQAGQLVLSIVPGGG